MIKLKGGIRIKNNNNNKLHNPHDKTFRFIFTNPNEAANFINYALGLYNGYLLTKDDLSLYNNTLISRLYNDRTTDVIYKITNNKKVDGDVFVIIEHQSYIDKSMPIRMLEYKSLIMRENYKPNKSDKFPLVIGIVIYTGNRNWNVSDNIINNQAHLLGYKNQGVDLFKFMNKDSYSKEMLLSDNNAYSKALLLEFADNNISEIDTVLSKIKYISLSNEARDILEGYIVNVIGSRYDNKFVSQMLSYIREGGKSNMFADVIHDAFVEREQFKKEILQFRKNEEKSKAQILQFKKNEEKLKKDNLQFKEGLRNTTLKLLKLNIPIEEIVEITNLSKNEILEIKNYKS